MNVIAGAFVTRASSDLVRSARPGAPVATELASRTVRRSRAVESGRWRRAD